MTEVLSERVLDRVPFRDLGFSRLFADYCDAAAPAVSFFGSHFRSDLNARLRQVPPFDATSRGILVDVLSEQNARWQASPATHDNIDRLSNPGARCIVTGQQLGLFVSPLYTIYKSLTTLHLAAKLSTDEIPVVPVFWLADEDHDLDEIDHCLLPGKDGVARIEYPRGFDSQGPTGALIVDSDSQRALSELRTHLSDLPYAESILNDIEACYASGVSFADAFASLLHRMLPERALSSVRAPTHVSRNAQFLCLSGRFERLMPSIRPSLNRRRELRRHITLSCTSETPTSFLSRTASEVESTVGTVSSN